MSVNMDNILESVREVCDVSMWDDTFDSRLKLFVNGNFLNLAQLGVTAAENFQLVDGHELWSDFITEPSPLLNSIKTWMCLKCRMQFDPPTGSVADSINATISECEWRINSQIDYPVK